MSFYRSLGAKFQILLVVSLALLLGFFFLSTVSIAEVNNLHTKLGDKENYLLSFLIKMGISFVVVSALCVSAVYYVLTQTFLPVEAISDLLTKVAQNDLQVDLLESKRQDEIGIISQSIDNVILGFSGVLTSIKFTGEQIGDAGKTVNKDGLIPELWYSHTDKANDNTPQRPY